MKTFGEILKEKRKARGWSRYKLAAKISSSASCIRAWEDHGRNPTLIFLMCLADVFKCSIDELVGYKVKE